MRDLGSASRKGQIKVASILGRIRNVFDSSSTFFKMRLFLILLPFLFAAPIPVRWRNFVTMLPSLFSADYTQNNIAKIHPINSDIVSPSLSVKPSLRSNRIHPTAETILIPNIKDVSHLRGSTKSTDNGYETDGSDGI